MYKKVAAFAALQAVVGPVVHARHRSCDGNGRRLHSSSSKQRSGSVSSPHVAIRDRPPGVLVGLLSSTLFRASVSMPCTWLGVVAYLRVAAGNMTKHTTPKRARFGTIGTLTHRIYIVVWCRNVPD